MSSKKQTRPAGFKLVIYLLVFSVLTGISLLFEWHRENENWHEAARSNQEGTGIEEKDETSLMDNSGRQEDEIADTFPVYLVGAVKKPGIYQVEPETCLFELVDLAGGLSAAAAADIINLAMPLQPYQHIYIPTKEELRENPALIDSLQERNPARRLIDINLADQSSLETLPGIGPVTARAIIDYREKNGPFARVEDLMQVPGIKESRFAALEDLIIVSGGS